MTTKKMTTPQDDESADRDLLDRYVAGRDEEAFRILVQRHAGHVHSVARRVTASSDLAADVAQAVFVRLAERAAFLPRRVPLAAWLHRTGRSLAIDLVRAEVRRKKLELAASLSTAMDPLPQKSTSWADLAPVIDELVDRLPPLDRDILLLRYYDNRSLGSIGRQHGLTEDTAGKRAARALEKLRTMLGRRGIVTSTAALELLLPAHAAVPASQALTLTIVSATRGVAPAIPGFLASTILTMTTKTIVTTAAAAAVLLGSAAYLAVGHVPGPRGSSGSPKLPAAGVSGAGPVTGISPSPSPSESATRPPRERRPAAPGRTPASPPAGIDPVAWRAAAGILEQLSDGKFLLNGKAALPPDKLKQLQGVLGLDDAAVASISGLIADRVAAEEKRSADFLHQQMAASTDLQELFALSEQQKTGTLTPEQDARRNEIGSHYADVFGDFQKGQAAWYDDPGFLDSVKGKLQPGDAAGFDSFVQEQSDAIHEAEAFAKSQDLATQLNLDKDQRQAIYEEISNNNGDPDAIASHLRPEQVQIYNQIKGGKKLFINSH
jgi:RNA polymerase sigma factor (sigma-70 family)